MSGPLIAMRKADGPMDSEVHFAGHVAKPDQDGVVLIPSEFVIALLMAGYVHATQT
jgi:hypothetical protein